MYEKKIANGLIEIEVVRNGQADIIDRLEDVDGFIVKDNGIGFTKDNRDSFDTLYTEQKITDGGKGFGRFTCLKYFDRVKDRKSTRLNSSHYCESRMQSSA